MPQTRSARASLDANGSASASTPSRAGARQSDAGQPPPSPQRTKREVPQNWGARNALQIALFGVCAGACSGWALSVPPRTDFMAYSKQGWPVAGLQALQSFSDRFEATRLQVRMIASSVMGPESAHGRPCQGLGLRRRLTGATPIPQISSFDFIVGQTPLSSLTTPVYAVLGYAAVRCPAARFKNGGVSATRGPLASSATRALARNGSKARSIPASERRAVDRKLSLRLRYRYAPRISLITLRRRACCIAADAAADENVRQDEGQAF